MRIVPFGARRTGTGDGVQGRGGDQGVASWHGGGNHKGCWRGVVLEVPDGMPWEEMGRQGVQGVEMVWLNTGVEQQRAPVGDSGRRCPMGCPGGVRV